MQNLACIKQYVLGNTTHASSQRPTNLSDVQLQELVKYFQGYPREMFKDAILRL